MWFWCAIMASALWGLDYVVNQSLLRAFRPIELMLVHAVVILLLFIPWTVFNTGLKATFIKFMDVKLALLCIASALIYVFASVLIFKSISSSNATLAAIIEASYPIFTMVFAYFILGEKQFTTSTVIGCLLVIIGLVIIQRGK